MANAYWFIPSNYVNNDRPRASGLVWLQEL